MTTLLWLAGRTFCRRPIRTALVVVGLSVTGALLLDMMMLAGGLQASLGQVLSQMGFAVRVVPKGTTPFSGIAEIRDGDRLAAVIGEQPGVAAALPIVATNLYVWHQAAPFASFAFGVPRGETGAYVIVDGRDLSRQGSGDPSVVVSRTLASFDGVRVGDTLTAATAAGAVLEGTGTPERFQVVGIADFYLDLASQRSMVMRTADLRRLQRRPQGAAAEILVRMADPDDQVAALLSWLGTRHPEVDGLSTERYLSRIGARLTYFNQFALILSTLSLAISFLLITAMVTLSLGERLGEIAMLRALGFTRGRIGILILYGGPAAQRRKRARRVRAGADAERLPRHHPARHTWDPGEAALLHVDGLGPGPNHRPAPGDGRRRRTLPRRDRVAPPRRVDAPRGSAVVSPAPQRTAVYTPDGTTQRAWAGARVAVSIVPLRPALGWAADWRIRAIHTGMR